MAQAAGETPLAYGGRYGKYTESRIPPRLKVSCLSSAYKEGLRQGTDIVRHRVSTSGPAGQSMAGYEGVFSSH